MTRRASAKPTRHRLTAKPGVFGELSAIFDSFSRLPSLAAIYQESRPNKTLRRSSR